ncbi:MAG: GPR endopeptidase [Clostridia bacterium]|nr:GPR endopeptidase [Clostridia bacterium]
MGLRTDLISENTANIKQIPEGCVIESYKKGRVNFELTQVLSDEISEMLGKPKGKYITLSFDRLDRITDTKELCDGIIDSLEKLFEKRPESVTVVGLGNNDITPDALGPLTSGAIFATRHLSEEFKANTGLSHLGSVSVIAPGVMGKTGIETRESVKAAIDFIKPDAIIVIDALAAGSTDRLCSTFQLTNTGISPGSGVKNTRKAFNEEALGIPVIAIGMPTVIDFGEGENMMVTPKDIDLLIDRAAELLSLALNRFLHPHLDSKTLAALT